MSFTFFQVKHFILVNCGGTINLIEDLDAGEDIVFYVLDRYEKELSLFIISVYL